MEKVTGIISKVLGFIQSRAYIFVPLIAYLALATVGYLGFPNTIEWALAHMGFVLFLLIPVIIRLSWALVNNRRKQFNNDPKNKSSYPKPMLPKFGQAWRDWFDLTFFVDNLKRRLFNYAITIGTIVITVLFPFGRTAPDAPTITSFNDLIVGWTVGTPINTQAIVIALGTPVLWWALIASRARKINKERGASLEMIYNIAASCLKYPRKTARIRPEEAPFQSPRGAIQVKKWKGLVSPEIYFIASPITLDINDKESWNKLQANLETKLPSDTGWHFEFDPRGKGATVQPASYPFSVLWDGEQDPDPLTFLLGADLDNPGEFLRFTFGETSPHSATVGATGSGKRVRASTLILSHKNDSINLVQNKNLELGDVIFDNEGNPAKITAFSDWQKVPTHRIHFSDGSHEDVSGDHRHTTYDRAARISESKNKKIERKREGWLPQESIDRLITEGNTCSPDSHISVKELAELAGLKQPNKAIYDLAKAIGVSKEQTILKECHYAEQEVQQKQSVVVFSDRKKTLETLSTYYKSARNANVRANSTKVEALMSEDAHDITSVELKTGLGVDWSNISRTLTRAGITHGVKEKRIVTLKVPAKTVMKESGVINYYPRRDMCLELARMGAEPWHDQQHLRSMPKIRTTQEIMDTLKVGEHVNHSIKNTLPIQLPTKELKCDPYVLGAWLGDGAIRAVKNRVTLWATEDYELFESIEVLEPKVKFTSYRDKTLRDGSVSLRSKDYTVIGLSDILPEDCVVRDEKFSKFGYRKQIPNDYRFASIDQRWALLQGLMDTDGSVSKGGNCEFYQSEKLLAEQVRSLVASLGITATLREKQGSYRDLEGNLVECKVSYTVAFTPPPGAQVFRLQRKQSRLDASNEARREYVSQHRYIVDVEVLEDQWMRCIAVDSPTHQFLVTDQFIPTHNTSVTEAIVAQAATKPMPWSPEDDPIYATTYIIDPKGPFANRWEGRPNIITVNGTRDTIDEEGEPISGIEAMTNMVNEFYSEMQRRGQIIDSFGVAKWLDLSEDVLRKERMAPWFIALDEYLDHTDKLTGSSEQTEKDNAARQILTEKVLLIARKGRSFGFHIMLIAQMANMTVIGNALMRQLVARIIMGNMDDSTYQSFFQTTNVPLLPTTRVVEGKRKGIPGRGRILNSAGQDISRMQAFWFGGKENSETLDKHLPRKSSVQVDNEYAEADIDDYHIDEHGPAVVMSPENVSEETVNGKPIQEQAQIAPEEPSEGSTALDAPTTPKKEKGASKAVVSATDLFGNSKGQSREEKSLEKRKAGDEGVKQTSRKESKRPEPAKNESAPQEKSQGKFDPCMVCGETHKITRQCENPKCENMICFYHKKSPDGRMWLCPDCGKKHILTRMKLGSLYPNMRNTVEKAGGTITWDKKPNKVEVSVRMDNVELMKVIGTPEGVEGMDGNTVADGPAEVRAMLKNALS